MNNLDILFKAFSGTDRGRSEAAWNIITAMRGPDSSTVASEDVKELTTMRVRAFVLCDKGGMRSTPCIYDSRVNVLFGSYVQLSELNKVQRDRRNVLLKSGKVPEHFACHYRRAVKGIQLLYNYNLWSEKIGNGD